MEKAIADMVNVSDLVVKHIAEVDQLEDVFKIKIKAFLSFVSFPLLDQNSDDNDDEDDEDDDNGKDFKSKDSGIMWRCCPLLLLLFSITPPLIHPSSRICLQNKKRSGVVDGFVFGPPMTTPLLLLLLLPLPPLLLLFLPPLPPQGLSSLSFSLRHWKGKTEEETVDWIRVEGKEKEIPQIRNHWRW